MRNLMRICQRKEKTAGLDMPIKDASFVVLDTELTGLDLRKDSIVSVGAVRMRRMSIDVGSSYYGVASPDSELTKESVVIHGITPSDVAGKPRAAKVLDEFLKFCGDDVIVGHCIGIDIEFINKEMKKAFGYTLANKIVDTFGIHEWLKARSSYGKSRAAGGSGLGLYDMAKQYGIQTRGLHNALMDAYITAQVFQRFIPILAEEGVKELGDLLRIGDTLKGGDRFGPSAGIWRF